MRSPRPRTPAPASSLDGILFRSVVVPGSASGEFLERRPPHHRDGSPLRDHRLRQPRRCALLLPRQEHPPALQLFHLQPGGQRPRKLSVLI
ncbi:hypothetical protein L596_024342 [Steinernema carpocapsae]|uniref:Uncharacterized protein n=1 Tax=Steinernema carpocapsae TaxID=34508 RepID=A0A4U5MGH1_STECR|nr:hypothetical protein L596_024342 [Steinernema carpocapsae]